MKLNENSSSPSLAVDEKVDIQHRVNHELNETQFKMIKLGGITNIITGIFVVWILFNKIQTEILISWYVALVGVNVVNILFSLYYDFSKVTPDQIKPWLHVYHIILACLCLTWGSAAVLFVTPHIYNQLYILVFLLAVLVGFSLGTVTDFVASVISIICILTPYISFHVYRGVNAVLTEGADPNLNLGLSVILLILGLFLLITCFIGNRLIKKSFTLTFENISLSKKLEHMNKFLEQRVKERTIELEKSLKLVTYQATHDLLTDLPNQRLLLEYTQSAIKNALANQTIFCVVFFSLNEIEKINDGLGHEVGDLVIKTIAQRFVKKFDQGNFLTDLASRYIIALSRKDVFVILISPINQIEEVEKKASLLFSILEEPVYSENQVIKLTASMGISVYPRNGSDVHTLFMNADAAMLRAKQFGGNSLNMYKAEINADISKQLELESNLHTALRNSEFMLHYQPFVDIQTGEISGAEALVRWENPSLGLISPDNFIPLAEANGIIIPLGEWVLRTACLQTKAWHKLGFTNLKVAINLSAKQLQQKNIDQVIGKILQEVSLDPKYIELELTETEAFQKEVFHIITKFKAMGLGLAIDDFGTGYSGLTNLREFNIDKLKIDKSFVQDIEKSSDSKTIVANTIALAKKLDITVLAEGVETKEQLKFLQENGCDLVQGYYFSPPVNTEVFTKILVNKTKFPI